MQVGGSESDSHQVLISLDDLILVPLSLSLPHLQNGDNKIKELNKTRDGLIDL